MTATPNPSAGRYSNDQEHLQLLLARLWAAEHALAAEIREDLDVSLGAAQVLARMRIDELIDGPRETGDPLVLGYPNESYCRKCWALVTPDTSRRRQGELFDACSFCGQAADVEDEWREAA